MERGVFCNQGIGKSARQVEIERNPKRRWEEMLKKGNDARLGVSASLSQCQPQRLSTSFFSPQLFTKFLSMMTNMPLFQNFSEGIPTLSCWCQLMHLETNYSAKEDKDFPASSVLPIRNKKSKLSLSPSSSSCPSSSSSQSARPL